MHMQGKGRLHFERLQAKISIQIHVCFLSPIVHLTFKDYTQTLENKLSSARSWSVSNIRCSEKFTGTQKCQKLVVLVNFEGPQKQALLEVKQKLKSRMAISYPSTEFENIFLLKFRFFQELALLQICKDVIFTNRDNS